METNNETTRATHTACCGAGRRMGRCENCGVPDPLLIEFPATKVTDTASIDSGRIDNAMLVRTVEHLQERIRKATWSLRKGLKFRSNPVMAEIHFRQALRELGSLGAS